MKKKETTVEDVLRIKRISYVILAVIWLIFLLLLAFFGSRAYWAHFSPEKWQTHPDRRAYMTEDLLEKHRLTGMTEAEVTALLGENDNDRSYFTQQDRFVYWLGDRRTIIDSEWLLVDFTDGVVTDYQWTED